MIRISSTYLFLILSMPFCFGIFLFVGIPISANIIFTFLLIFLSIIIIFKKRQVVILDKNICLLLIAILGVLVNIVSVRYTFPVFYFAYLAVLHIVIYNINTHKGINVDLNKVILIYIILSVATLIIGVDDSRFQGFSTSATTFSTYFTAVLLITLFYEENGNKSKKIIIYIVGLLAVLLTLTRINILFYLIIPVNELLARSSKRNKVKYIITFIITSSLAYPIYEYLISLNPELISIRYDGGIDKSFATRSFLTASLIQEWYSQPLISKLFGAGTEFSRLYIIKELGIEILPHNDFLRILIDYGIFFSFAYLSYLVRLMLKNKITFHLGLLYIISFYHNMVFNIFIISLIIIFYYFDNIIIGDNKNRISEG